MYFWQERAFLAFFDVISLAVNKIATARTAGKNEGGAEDWGAKHLRTRITGPLLALQRLIQGHSSDESIPWPNE